MTPAAQAPAVAWADLPAARRFELHLTVQETDLDELHHVNNVVYLAWCEQVARAHARSLHMDTPELSALGVVPVAQEHRIRYLKPALLGDLLRVRTWLTHSAGVRSVRSYTIERVEENAATSTAVSTLLVTCQTDWVWVDPHTGRPKRLPPAVLQAFGFG